jgi:hypothetical protein
MATALGCIVRRALDRDGAAEQILNAALASPDSDRSFVRALLPQLPPQLAPLGLAWLIRHLAADCAALTPDQEDTRDDPER